MRPLDQALLLQLSKEPRQVLLPVPSVRVLLDATDDVDALEDVDDVVDPSSFHDEVLGDLADVDDGAVVVAVGRGVLEEVHEVLAEDAEGFVLTGFVDFRGEWYWRQGR